LILTENCLFAAHCSERPAGEGELLSGCLHKVPANTKAMPLSIPPVVPKSSPKRMATKKMAGVALGGLQFLGATLKILALTAQIRHKSL
jgi:hypothetical protein